MFILSAVILILLIFYDRVRASGNEDETCRVLVFGGGGDRGAWSGGAIKAIVEYIDTRYKIVAGTSIGAINAGLFSQSKIGDDVLGAKYVENFWKTIKREDIYTEWPDGLLAGLIKEPGLFDTEVAINKTFYDYMNLTMFRESDRKTYFGSTNLETGEFVNFNYTFPNIPLAVAASSAIPGLFPPILIDGVYHVDGGVSCNAPVTLPMQKCHQYYPGQKVVVDVVYCVADLKDPKFLEDHMITPLVLVQAGLAIVNEIVLNDLQFAEEAFPNAEVNVYMPQQHLKSLFINFNHDEMEKMFQIGYDEAKEMIVGGGGG